MSKDGGPAFPFIVQDCSKYQVFDAGISKLEFFAAAALQGLLASADVAKNVSFEDYSVCAYHHAAAMLAELERRAKE